MHLSDGQLRAHLDGEAAGGREDAASAHLAGCSRCQGRLAQMEERAARVSTLMAGLAPGPAQLARQERQAWLQLKKRRGSVSPKENNNVFQSLFSQRFRSAWIGLGAVVAVALALSFAPVRVWAGEMLGLFRVQQIRVLPVDVTRFSQLTDDSTLADQISQMFSQSVVETRESGKPQVAASAAEASQLAGFNVRLLSGAQGAPQIVVQDGSAFEFSIDRDLAQSILDEAGRSDLQLPASLDGATISVDIPTAVSIAYGECPDLSQVDAENGEEVEQESRRYNDPTDCVILAEVPSPTVETPPDVNLGQLAEIGLQFSGMSAAEARAFSQTVDWTSTLVIPIPRNGAAYEQVQVDGVTGNLIYRQSETGAWDRYTLLWVKDGVVYALTAYGDKAEGIQLANSLQ